MHTSKLVEAARMPAILMTEVKGGYGELNLKDLNSIDLQVGMKFL
jgi:hypothetical protein